MENLIKIMIDPRHGLHSLLPETVNQIRQRQTRSNGEKLYNFRYRTEVTKRFKNSPIVHGIESFSLIQGWSRLVEVNLSIPSKHFLN